MGQQQHIVIVGMKHAGKSTVGSLLAQRLERVFFDTDAIIERDCGKSARQLYDEGGAELLAKREIEACERLVATDPSVIATGGGLADNPQAIEILKKKGTIIYLDVPIDILYARILESAEKDGRFPKFLQGENPKSRFEEVFSRRSTKYATMANVRIQTLARMPEEIVQDIMDYIEHE